MDKLTQEFGDQTAVFDSMRAPLGAEVLDFKYDLGGPFTVILRHFKSGFFYTIVGCLGGRYIACRTHSVLKARTLVESVFLRRIRDWEPAPRSTQASKAEVP